MKDYYYFLGLRNDASDDEIRRAYRKLSLKYHPDVNGDDIFFASRFREVQEAYEHLIDREKRRFFDQNYNPEKKASRSRLPPVITTFNASKIRVKKGDEITLNWETQNADVVKILPFGLEKSSGNRIFKITEFKDGQFHVVLQALNTLTNQSVVQGITFVEVFNDVPEASPRHTTATSEAKTAQPQPKVSAPLVILAVLIALAVILLMLDY